MFHITCTACHGAGDPACPKCNGAREPVYRCPRAHATPEIDDAFHALDWVEAGVLPVQGGLLDQSASFMAFAQIVAAERAAIDKEEREAGERLRRSAEGHGRRK